MAIQTFNMTPTPSSASMIGSAIGEGLSKRAGLAEAQQEFQEAQGDPLKLATAFARLTSVSPELARGAGPMYQAMLSQMQGKAMGTKENQPAPFNYPTTDNQPGEPNAPSITKGGDILKQIESFIPPTEQQKLNEAGQMYRENPMQFGGDPNNARDFVDKKYIQEEKIAEAYKTRHTNLNALQDDVVNRLRKQAKDLDSKIPATVMSEMEKNAIADVKGGMTEQEAMRKHGEKIDQASRDYQKIEDIGSWGLITSPSESISSIKSLRKDFKKRDDLRNFADTLAAKLKVSYSTAYAFADPVSEHPALNNYIKDLPNNEDYSRAGTTDNTERIVPKLAKLIAEENASPQSVFHEMIEKNYDPTILKEYLDNNRDKLKLSAFQADQIGKESAPLVPFLNDLFVRIMGGLE